jgi:SAM-dependent methyltransferase
MEPMLAAQQDAWRVVERARGRADLSPEDVLRLPEEPPVQALLNWLRGVLRARGCCRVLEIGAGQGWASRALAEDGHQVVASEIQDDSKTGLGCASCLRVLSGNDFACVRTAAEALPFRAQAFDCVFCFSVLRHIVDLERVLQEASRVLRPGGLFVALQEPFRGILTTPPERLQDCITYRLAHWWLVGTLPSSAGREILQIRASLGSTLFEMCRRVPFCLETAQAAGLTATVLPTAVALTLPPDLQGEPARQDDGLPRWLESFATAYELDWERLGSWLGQAAQESRQDLLSKLLAHWCCVANTESVFLAQKGGSADLLWSQAYAADPGRARNLDPVLLACSSQGFLPVYGIYPAEGDPLHPSHWLQPHAGLLVAGTESVELTFTGPPPQFWGKPVRVELRLEAERAPLLVFLAYPGKTETLRVPIPKPFCRQPSLLLRLTTNLGFIPNDFNPTPGGDTRLLALQLGPVRPGS